MSDTTKICISCTDRPDDPGNSVWLTLPTTPAQFQDALQSVGADLDRQNYAMTFFQSDIPALDRLLIARPDAIIGASFDELNYAAATLTGLSPTQREKLDAVADSPMCFLKLERIIDYPHNTDFFLLIPEAKSNAELGRYYAYKSGMVDMPEEWKASIDFEKLGAIAAEMEMGVFTKNGYLMLTGDEWKPHFERHGQIPEQFCLTKPDAEKKPSIKDHLKTDRGQPPKTTPHKPKIPGRER